MLNCIIFFILYWYISLFSQTFWEHRYAAHNQFKMSKNWEKFFYLFAFFTQGSSYLSARVYGILHRMHHAYTDTELDPHSPRYDKNAFWMMWRTRSIYNNILYNRIAVDPKFEKNLPEWRSFDTFANHRLTRVVWIILYILLFYYVFKAPWFCYVLIPFIALMGPIHGVVVNWFAHKVGHRNFEMDNDSTNLLPVDFLMLGEGYHNNHHKYPSRPNFGVKWYEFDPIYPVIKGLDFLKIIQLNKA